MAQKHHPFPCGFCGKESPVSESAVKLIAIRRNHDLPLEADSAVELMLFTCACPHCSRRNVWIYSSVFPWLGESKVPADLAHVDGDDIPIDHEAWRLRLREWNEEEEDEVWYEYLPTQSFYRIYPPTHVASEAPAAEFDKPQEVLRDYNEARAIYHRSPRAAAALLRLAIHGLCIHLGAPGKNLNEDIGVLQERGLPADVIDAMDVVRVRGNNAIHPGQMDDADSREQVGRLFDFVNFAVKWTISMPGIIKGDIDSLPESIRKAIEKRNRRNDSDNKDKKE